MEIWNDIPNQPPNYQVSNIGNVRSLDFNRTKITRNLVKKESFSKNLCVKIQDKGYSVAQLVLIAFVEPRPSPKHFAFHKDGNTLNDCAENLEWRHLSFQNRINGKNGNKYQKGHPPHSPKTKEMKRQAGEIAAYLREVEANTALLTQLLANF